MAQKWYEKATVQSSLVNASVNRITAAIAIFAIWQTSSYANVQLQQTQVNFEKQMNRDSILNIEQDSATKRQTNLAKLQLKVLQNQYMNDSINKMKELQIFEKELIIQNKRSNEEEILIEKALIMTEIRLTKYECNYTKNDIDSVFRYEVDYEYDVENFKVKKEIILNQCLALFDENKKTEIYTKNIFLLRKVPYNTYNKMK